MAVHHDPNRPVYEPPGEPPVSTDQLRRWADDVESWSKVCTPELAGYYRQRALFYRAEAVRRLMAEAMA